MSQYNAKKLLIEWLKADRLKDVISGLAVFENQLYDIQQKLPLLQARFTENEINRLDKNANIDEVKIEQNKLREAFLSLINNLPDDAYITLEDNDNSSEKKTPPQSKPFKWRYIFITGFVLMVIYFGWQETRFGNAFRDGEAKFNSRDYQGAILDFTKAKEAATSDEEKLYLVYTYLGASKSKIGDVNGAIEDCNMAIKLNPRYSGAYLRRGDVWLDKHQWVEAINDYTEAIKLHTTDPEIYYNRGRAFFYKGDFQMAIRDFSEAQNLRPNAAKLILYARGMAHDTLGHKEEARLDFEQSCQDGEPRSCEILKTKFSKNK